MKSSVSQQGDHELEPPAFHSGWLSEMVARVTGWMGHPGAALPRDTSGVSPLRPRTAAGEHPAVTFADVAAGDRVKADLQDIVDVLKRPRAMVAPNMTVPRGVLLAGPHGTGKTLLARAVAGQAGAPLFQVSASEFVGRFAGSGASRLRELFAQARAASPALVFIDELDAVGRPRGGGDSPPQDVREQALDQLLAEMGSLNEHRVIVFAATHRPEVLDPELLRPGRFERLVTLTLPDRSEREKILRIHARTLNLAPDIDLQLLARTTTGLSGATLASLVNEAALSAERHAHVQVTMADFEEGLDRILLRGVRPVLLDAQERRAVAYHQAGHAVVAWLTPNADPVRALTILRREQAVGELDQLSDHDTASAPRDLRARLAVLLGGRVAEEIAQVEATTRGDRDLAEAARLARQIDDRVDSILQERHEYVLRLLVGARDRLDLLARTLLDEETLDASQLAHLLGSRPPPEAPDAPPSQE